MTHNPMTTPLSEGMKQAIRDAHNRWTPDSQNTRDEEIALAVIAQDRKERESETCMTLSELQRIASEWSRKNFGEHFGSGYRNLLGVSEEVGELCHAQLKGEQGIRHTPEEIVKMKKDAVGDILVFLANYCDSQKLDMMECAQVAIDEILKRDWRKQGADHA